MKHRSYFYQSILELLKKKSVILISKISSLSSIVQLISFLFFFCSRWRKWKGKEFLSILTNVSNDKLRAYVLAFGSIVAKTRKKKPVTCFVSRVVFYGALTSLVYSDCIVADKFQSSTVPILTFSNENRGTKADSFHLIPDMIKNVRVTPSDRLSSEFTKWTISIKFFPNANSNVWIFHNSVK